MTPGPETVVCGDSVDVVSSNPGAQGPGSLSGSSAHCATVSTSPVTSLSPVTSPCKTGRLLPSISQDRYEASAREHCITELPELFLQINSQYLLFVVLAVPSSPE